MSRKGILGLILLAGCLTVCAWGGQGSTLIPVPGDPLPGKGDLSRTVLTYDELFSDATPTSPLNDGAFTLPANAAMPLEQFEGKLELLHPESSGGFTKIFDYLNISGDADSSWKHLPAFSFEFVQNGSHLIPVRQGLIFTGSPSWNYILGPGRVWNEKSDSGYTRASFPFAIAWHNGLSQPPFFLFISAPCASKIFTVSASSLCTAKKRAVGHPAGESSAFAPFSSSIDINRMSPLLAA